MKWATRDFRTSVVLPQIRLEDSDNNDDGGEGDDEDDEDDRVVVMAMLHKPRQPLPTRPSLHVDAQ